MHDLPREPRLDAGGGGDEDAEAAIGEALTALRAAAPPQVRASWPSVVLQIAAPLREAIARDWRDLDLTEAMQGTQHAQNPTGAYIARLRALARQPPPAPTAEQPARPGCPQCAAGWLGEDVEARPIPCPTCRPALTQRLALAYPTRELT